MRSARRLVPSLVGVAGLLLLAPAAHAACSAPLSAAELARHVSAAEGAFSSMDEVTFLEELHQAEAAIECLSEALSPQQAAALHRARALAAFVDRQHAQVVASYRAALVASPGYVLPETYAGEDHPLRIDFEAAEGMVDPAPVPLSAPKGESFRVDGRESEVAPQGRPYVLQRVDANGKVIASTLVDPGEAAVVAAPAVASDEPSGEAHPGRARALAAVAGAAAITSGGLYLAADGRADRFWDPATPDDELDTLRRQVNTTSALSLAAGIVAAGTGAAAVVSWAW